MEATELEDVESLPSSPDVDSPSDEPVKPKSANNNSEELGPKTQGLKGAVRRRGSLKTPANKGNETSKTPTAKNSKSAKATKSALTTPTTTSKNTDTTPMKDDEEAEIPNGTTKKKKGRTSKSSVATPVDATEDQTPKGSKPAEGKKKKIVATPAIERSNDLDSPNVDSSTPEPTAVKKKKSLSSKKKTDSHAAEGEDGEDVTTITTNMALGGDPKARGRKKSVGKKIC